MRTFLTVRPAAAADQVMPRPCKRRLQLCSCALERQHFLLAAAPHTALFTSLACTILRMLNAFCQQIASHASA